MVNQAPAEFHFIDKDKASLAWIAEFLSIDAPKSGSSIEGLSSAHNPKPNTLTFVQTPKGINFDALSVCAAVLCKKANADKLPSNTIPLIVDAPHAAFAAVARALYPASLGNARRRSDDDAYELVNGAFISPTAIIEENVSIEPSAVIGPGACIGKDTYIGANVTISANCQVGRNCSIGSGASLQYCLTGNNVMIHAGARIGQDGFGFVPGATGLEKMPQLGRVLIQDNVEIGANATVDRGALDDTIIGEGTKIDNSVQIGHNVVIGRSCAIAAFAGISGSAKLGDGCLIGGRVGIADHITIGNGVQLAATSSVMNNIPDGEKWAGTPAQPFKAFFREQATLRRLVNPNKNKQDK